MKALLFVLPVLLCVSGCTKDERLSEGNPTIVADLHENSLGPGSWTRKANFPGQGTETPVAFTIGTKAYVGMGNGATDFWEYDSVTNTWLQKSGLGTLSNGRASFSIKDKGYAGLGTAFGNSGNDFYQYDPVSDQWSNVADFPGTSDNNIFAAKGFNIGAKGYVLLANSANGQTEMYEYNPSSDAWFKRASLPIPSLEGTVAFSIGNLGYAGTGFAPIGNLSFELVNQFWKYDPATDRWTRMADFGGGDRWLAAGFSIGNKGYIGTGATKRGGVGGLGPQCDFWEYNPSNNIWTKKASLPASVRAHAAGFSIGSRGYLGFGTVQGPSSPIKKTDFWEFDPGK